MQCSKHIQESCTALNTKSLPTRGLSGCSAIVCRFITYTLLHTSICRLKNVNMMYWQMSLKDAYVKKYNTYCFVSNSSHGRSQICFVLQSAALLASLNWILIYCFAERFCAMCTIHVQQAKNILFVHWQYSRTLFLLVAPSFLSIWHNNHNLFVIFTDDLTIILRQFLDSWQSYDSCRIHKTFMTIAEHILRQNLMITS